MKLKLVAVTAALSILTACVTINVAKVTPGSYPNYREMLVAQLMLVPFGAPRELVHKVSVCGADVMVDNLTPTELDRLDRYARGELKLSDDELERFDSDLRKRTGGKEGLDRLMRNKCPDVFKEAEAYKKANGG